MIQFVVPVKTVSEANRHEHWRARQKRAKEQRTAAKLLTLQALRGLPTANALLAACGHKTAGLPDGLVITLTRRGPRPLDSDNLAGSQKHVRDGIADALGIDDGSDRLEWRYGQKKFKRGHHGTEVEISERI